MWLRCALCRADGMDMRLSGAIFNARERENDAISVHLCTELIPLRTALTAARSALTVG